MSLETSIIPDIEKIANMKKDTGVWKNYIPHNESCTSVCKVTGPIVVNTQ